MGSVNRVILVGNLTRDSELRYTPGGAAVSTFTVATNETWTDKESGQKKEKSEFHRVVLWGKQAESVNEYLTKGKQVFVEGRLQTRQWEQKGENPGDKPTTRYTTEIKADRIVLLGGGGQRAAGAGGGRYDREHGEPTADTPSQPVDITDDDIPF